jgi:Phage capsid family
MKHESQSAFRREVREASSGNLCTRALTARTLTSLWRRRSIADVAAELYPNDRALLQMITRAASAPAMTGVAGWAAELVHKIVADTLDALGPASAAADVMKRGLTLEWNGAGIISAPGFVASAANASFVAEGQPIPVRQYVETPAQLLPHKLASISALTREMAESSNAEALITDVVTRSTGLALDAVFFGAAAATAAQPAGLLYNVAASPPSANTDAFGAFFEDIATLVNAVGQVGGNGPFIIVASAGRLVSATGRIRDDSPDTPVIYKASAAVGNNMLAIAPQAVVAAISAEPDVETVNAATLVMDDTAPSTPDTTQPTKGMWQTDSIALKCRWPVSWALRDPRGVAWLTPAWK